MKYKVPEFMGNREADAILHSVVIVILGIDNDHLYAFSAAHDGPD
jgi:hypothetical protein